ncbi:MAG TPA: methyltransferase [Rhodanobacteraceae bacterium]|nr:methyltransferase [Rhodanobacteraceae bacterium]
MPSSTDGAGDRALDTLLLPFASGALRWPENGHVLFLRARCNAALREVETDHWICQQTFRPDADALLRAGLRVAETVAETFPLVLMLPPRQREESRALMARALGHLAPNGTLVAGMLNEEGARSGEADLARLAGPMHSLSKNRARVFWTAAPDAGAMDRSLMTEWAMLDRPRPIADGRFVSRPGLFAWDRIDAASKLLADHLPEDLAGHGADLGAGYGYLAERVLARCPRVGALDLYEAESRGLELARTNLATAASRVPLDFLWHDVTRGLPRRYDFIVSNPPFHHGRPGQPELGRAFLAAAGAALTPGGRGWFVANRHLPYEAELKSGFGTLRSVVERDGFKVIEAVKTRA